MKTLLLLGIGMDSPDTIKKLYDANIKVIFVQQKALFNKETSLFADQIIITDFLSQDFHLFAGKLHEYWKFSAVLSLTESGVQVAAFLSEKWGLPGSNLASLEYLKDKGKMRNLLNQHNFSMVNYEICDTLQKIKSFISCNGLPILIKPIDGGGSQEIHLINTTEQAESVFTSLIDQGIKVIAEEFIDGLEYSVETFSFDYTSCYCYYGKRDK
jgi:biotin carboxylase